MSPVMQSISYNSTTRVCHILLLTVEMYGTNHIFAPFRVHIAFIYDLKISNVMGLTISAFVSTL